MIFLLLSAAFSFRPEPPQMLVIEPPWGGRITKVLAAGESVSSEDLLRVPDGSRVYFIQQRWCKPCEEGFLFKAWSQGKPISPSHIPFDDQAPCIDDQLPPV